MSRSIFGWDLPPGCTHRQIEEAAGFDLPCLICGLVPDECICPECPVCSAYGDPKCYLEHGLRRTEEQKFSLEVTKREEELWIQQDNDYWESIVEDMCDEDEDLMYIDTEEGIYFVCNECGAVALEDVRFPHHPTCDFLKRKEERNAKRPY